MGGLLNHRFFFLAGKEKTDRMASRNRKGDRKSYVSRYYNFFDEYEKLYRLISPSRMKILYLLRYNGKMTITEISQVLGRNYKNIHRDIKLLEKYNLVTIQKSGRNAYVIPAISTVTFKLFFAPGREKELEWELDADLLKTVNDAEKELEKIFGDLNLDI